MEHLIGEEQSGATFSECEKYRFTLWRRFDATDLLNSAPCKVEEMVAFICLNPSTADASKDDPTVRRCIDYSKQWGGLGFIMLNLFAYRATDPKDMKANIDSSMRQRNIDIVCSVAKQAKLVVCGWGSHGSFQMRDQLMLAALLKEKVTVHYLKLNSDGSPAHPLYLKKSLVPISASWTGELGVVQ
jgi:hypothetical protein